MSATEISHSLSEAIGERVGPTLHPEILRCLLGRGVKGFKLAGNVLQLDCKLQTGDCRGQLRPDENLQMGRNQVRTLGRTVLESSLVFESSERF